MYGTFKNINNDENQLHDFHNIIVELYCSITFKLVIKFIYGGHVFAPYLITVGTDLMYCRIYLRMLIKTLLSLERTT